MERFKDFFYKKNDIILALVILVVALVIIASRVSAIMDYPSTMAEQNSVATSQEANSKVENEQ
jgi:uncharacterized membrane protein YvbJ